MAESVHVKLTYTPEDSLRVAQFLRNQSFVYRNDSWLTGGLVFLSFIMIIVFMANDFSTLRIGGAMVFSALPALAAGVAVFVLHKVINPWLMRRTIAKHFEGSPSANEETSITFSEAEIKTKNKLTSSLIKWPAITKVTESDSDILFYSGKMLGIFVPKNSLDAAGQLHSLKCLLGEILGEKAKLQN